MKPSIESIKRKEFQKRQFAIQIELFKKHPKREYIEFILKNVASYFKISFEEIVGPSHSPMFFYPRCVAFKIANDNTTLMADLMYFFNRERTSYYYLLKKEKEILRYEIYNQGYEELKTMCEYDRFLDAKNSDRKDLKYNFETFKQAQNEA